MSAVAAHAEAGFPRGALIGAGALIGFALLATAAVRVGLVTAPPSPQQTRVEAGIKPIESRELRFLDRADGAVVVQDVGGRQVTTIQPGTKNGFVRGVMRGLARERHMHGMGQQAPFRLVLWADRELSLTDEATGREIELGAFGETNRAAFAAMLPQGKGA